MNCLDFEKLIPLYVGDDLAERRGRIVAEHLKACKDCQERAEKLRATQALLKSLALETVDDALLQEVRQRALNGLATETERKRFPVWRYALGAGLTALVVLAAITFQHPSNDRVVEVTPGTPKLTATETLEQAPTSTHRSQVKPIEGKTVLRKRKHFEALPTAIRNPHQSEYLMVKLVTDDPKVVIYWQVD